MRSLRSVFTGLGISMMSGMRLMKWRQILLVVMLGFVAMLTSPGSSPLQAQEISDTLRITVRGNLARVEIAMAEVIVSPMKVGQQGVLIARAYDDDGDPMVADFFWESSDPTLVSIAVTSDSTAVITALKKTTEEVSIILRATEKLEIYVAAWRSADGMFLGINEFTLDCAAYPDGTLAHLSPTYPADAPRWCEAQLCAYGIRGDQLVVQSALPPVCPILYQPPGKSDYTMPERIVSFTALARLFRG